MAAVSDTEWLPAPPAVTPPPGGRAVGRFRVERELGRGGMGVVLLAHDDRLDRPVAVKLLRADDPETLARFRLEAHALGGLTHPNAVRVYESGEEVGRPYLVLEYVSGQSLSDALQGGPLAPTRAAELIAQVAGAVHAAHALGVVHRDLKPSNILLDEAGTPKLTDFGVARRLGGSDGLTATNIALGTPGYMPPEQAAGKAPDPRTDVYGLGATLYECLTGRPPFVGATAAVLQQVMEADPVPPRRLNAGVPVDLETVCLKCLEKEPGRRYPTADDLAADLQRVVRGEPVRARPPSRREKVARWTRRNRGSAALAVVAGLSLVGGAGLAGWQAVRATRAQGLAEANASAARAAEAAAVADKTLAEEKGQEAAALAAFLRDDLLKQASSKAQANRRFDPDPNLTVREVLGRAAGRVGDRLGDRPAVAEAVRLTLADALRGVGDAAAAAEQARLAYDSRRGRLGPDHPDTVRALAEVTRGARNTARSAGVVPDLEESVRRLRAEHGPDHPDTVTATGTLAAALTRAGRPADAVAYFRDALRAKQEAHGPENVSALSTQIALGNALASAGQPVEAVAVLEDAVRRVRGVQGVNQPDTLNAMARLAKAYADADRPAEAVSLNETCLRKMQAHRGAGHPTTLTQMRQLATAYLSVGRRTVAAKTLADCLRLSRDKLGPTHPATLTTANSLGSVHKAAGRPAEAAPLFEEVWRGLPAADPVGVEARGDQGVCLYRLGRYAEAEPHLLASYAARARAAGTRADRLAKSRQRLADLYTAWGQPAEAAKWSPELAPAPRPAG